MTGHIADDLETTVGEAAASLRKLDGRTVTFRPTPDRWTIKEVIGHLIDSAANNHQRFVRAQYADELSSPKYQHNDWVRIQQYDSIDWHELLDFWSHYNRHLARLIRTVPAKHLAVRCKIGDNPPVTLEFLMQDYVDHLKHHLAKIRERLAAT